MTGLEAALLAAGVGVAGFLAGLSGVFPLRQRHRALADAYRKQEQRHAGLQSVWAEQTRQIADDRDTLERVLNLELKVATEERDEFAGRVITAQRDASVLAAEVKRLARDLEKQVAITIDQTNALLRAKNHRGRPAAKPKKRADGK